jgi:hypothetical protein
VAALTSRQITPAGTAPALAAATAGGDTMDTGPTNMLHVKTGATGATVTVDSVTACSQGFDHNLAVVVGANSEAFIGPITAQYNQPTTGLANITYSQVATVTVEALRF